MDVLLVSRGLAETRERAQALIMAGKVFVAEQKIDKAGERLNEDVLLEVRGLDHPYVSRGGVKLRGALATFSIHVGGAVAADIGASTGGFTDCLLQMGARRVYAIDVGYGQLHAKLRSDPRVINMERTNARYLRQEDLPEKVSLVVMDASFIGIQKLLPAISEILEPNGNVVALVKPQFEAGRDKIGKGGIVRDEAVRLETVDAVAEQAKAFGFKELARTDSTISGRKGNLESFLWLQLIERL